MIVPRVNYRVRHMCNIMEAARQHLLHPQNTALLAQVHCPSCGQTIGFECAFIVTLASGNLVAYHKPCFADVVGGFAVD